MKKVDINFCALSRYLCFKKFEFLFPGPLTINQMWTRCLLTNNYKNADDGCSRSVLTYILNRVRP